MAYRCCEGLALLAALLAGWPYGVHAQERTPSAPTRSPPSLGLPVGPVPGAAAQVRHPENPHAGDADAREQGRRLFVQFNCSGCHGGHGGGGMGPSLRDDTWIYGGRAAEIFASISYGRANGMPAFGSLVPADTIWRLTAYVESLGSPKEPEPPR